MIRIILAVFLALVLAITLSSPASGDDRVVITNEQLVCVLDQMSDHDTYALARKLDNDLEGHDGGADFFAFSLFAYHAPACGFGHTPVGRFRDILAEEDETTLERFARLFFIIKIMKGGTSGETM